MAPGVSRAPIGVRTFGAAVMHAAASAPHPKTIHRLARIDILRRVGWAVAATSSIIPRARRLATAPRPAEWPLARLISPVPHAIFRRLPTALRTMSNDSSPNPPSP